MKSFYFLVMTLLAVSLLADEKFELSPIFAEHMVLQRNLENNVWGKASTGTKVRVRFNGKSSIAKTDAQGVWKLQIPVGKAGGPFTFSGRS